MAHNLFQPHTYEKNMPDEEQLNSLEKEALYSQIKHFGQCPVQLFPGSQGYTGHPGKLVKLLKICTNEQEGHMQLQQLEIERLNAQIMDITAQNEQTLQERIEEYRNLEKFHRKKLNRTKEEGKFHFDKLKLKVQELKQKQAASKQQFEA